MNFGTTTRVIIQDQRARAIEPKLKALIVGAAQKAVAGLQYIVADDDFSELESAVPYGGDALPEPPCYVTLRGKGAGKKDSTVLYESNKVLTEKSAYEYQKESADAMSEATGETIIFPSSEYVVATTTQVTIHRNALLTPIYPFFVGSPLRIVRSGDGAVITGMTAAVRSMVAGKNIVAMYWGGQNGIQYEEFAADGTGGLISAGSATISDHVALFEDQFNSTTDGVAHGTVYIDYVYNDTDIANTMYYIEDIDSIRNVFGNDSLTIGPSGAAYNAYLYYLANGGAEGFYVYAAAATAEAMYLSAADLATALPETVRYKDAYEVIPITHDAGNLITQDESSQAILAAHIAATADIELRMERRGYVGLYMPADQIYTYDEFEHLCEIGQENEREYMIGSTSRYGSRAAYVSAMMNRNIYTSNERMTLCQTKYGIIDGKYVSAGTLMAIYVAYRRTFLPGYVLADTPLPFISSVSFAGLLGDIDHLDALQNYGVLSIYQAAPGSPVMIYYPCTAATDYIQKTEEYLVTGTDRFAREVRASLDPHTGRGEDNKTSPGFVGDKATRYLQKLQNFFPALKSRYVDKYGLFEDVELISITNNPDYEGGVMIALRILYKYAVNHIEVIVYI